MSGLVCERVSEYVEQGQPQRDRIRSCKVAPALRFVEVSCWVLGFVDVCDGSLGSWMCVDGSLVLLSYIFTYCVCVWMACMTGFETARTRSSLCLGLFVSAGAHARKHTHARTHAGTHARSFFTFPVTRTRAGRDEIAPQ